MVSIHLSAKPVPTALLFWGYLPFLSAAICFALDKFFCAVAASKEAEGTEA